MASTIVSIIDDLLVFCFRHFWDICRQYAFLCERCRKEFKIWQVAIIVVYPWLVVGLEKGIELFISGRSCLSCLVLTQNSDWTICKSQFLILWPSSMLGSAGPLGLMFVKPFRNTITSVQCQKRGTLKTDLIRILSNV